MQNNEERAAEVVREYKDIREDYRHEADIMDEEDELTAAIKDAIMHRLDQVDRTIIILYADCASFAKLGKRLGISHMTARKEVLRIRNRIIDILYEDENTTRLTTAHLHRDLHCGSERIYPELAVGPRKAAQDATRRPAPSQTL